MKTLFLGFFIFILIIAVFFYFILELLLIRDKIDKSHNTYNLSNDGFTIIKNVLDDFEINDIITECSHKKYKDVKSKLINNIKIKNIITSYIGEQYKFQDYIWIIEKSSVHTCHRDNNGDFFNKGQKYPSYTALIYLEDMDKCLGVIPSSHKDINSNNVNLSNNVLNLLCDKGDIIIFNANLIHVGTINEKDDNLRIQMKITHKDDIDKIPYYENFNKVLNNDNNLPKSFRIIQKNLSCALPVLSNITQNENIRTARGSDNGANIGIFQKMFSYLFYGNSNFYDLPNAF